MTEKQRPGLEEAEEHLSRRALEAGDPVGWFEQLYALGADGVVDLPWDRRQPHPALLGWAERRRPAGTGKTAVVPGCALGADAEFVGRGVPRSGRTAVDSAMVTRSVTSAEWWCGLPVSEDHAECVATDLRQHTQGHCTAARSRSATTRGVVGSSTRGWS